MIHIAVVGAGPSGIFAAAELLKHPGLSVDVFDRSPTPFGLVRYGVAPDHTKIKSVTTTLSKVFADPRAQFLGNVDLGKDLDLDDLRAAYDSVIIATGAPHARRLGIPGEDLPGNYAAADLVSWYNGHPLSGTPFTARAEAAAIIGAGNVSIDIARVLLKAGAGLRNTDAPESVLTTLGRDPVREVHILARRSVAEAKFSHAELRELEALADVDIVVNPADLELGAAASARCGASRAATARIETFRRWAARPSRGAAKRLHFRFLRSPTAVLGSNHVTGLRLQRNVVDADGALAAAGSEYLPVQAVIRSIGYTGNPISGILFDHDRGLIPNTAGRVEADLYVAGWIKRGPSGTIGTNKACAIQTVATLLAELSRQAHTGEGTSVARAARARLRAGLVTRLQAHPERHRRCVTWDGWTAIDAAEIDLGSTRGRARTKINNFRRLVTIGTQPDVARSAAAVAIRRP